MLTGNLQIAFYRKGKVSPKRLPLAQEPLALAGDLIQAFHCAGGMSREAIEEDLAGIDDYGQNPKVVKGLIKILFTRSEFAHNLQSDLSALREEVWDQVAQWWKNSTQELADSRQAAQEILPPHLTPPPEPIERWLFGDLAAQQLLTTPPKLTPSELLQRYNLEQAQGLLLQTEKMTLEIKQRGAQFRPLMQRLRFFRLLFRVLQQGNDQLTIEIQGPQAVLENSRSYGVELANFFPALLSLEPKWKMEAQIKRKGVARCFTLALDSDSGYPSPYRPKDQWRHDKISALIQRFNESYGAKFKAKQPLDAFFLPNGALLLPDLELLQGKKKIQVEWLRYFSTAKEEWLIQVAKALPKGYCFAIKAKGAQKKRLEAALPGQVLCFSTELTAPALKKILSEKVLE